MASMAYQLFEKRRRDKESAADRELISQGYPLSDSSPGAQDQDATTNMNATRLMGSPRTDRQPHSGPVLPRLLRGGKNVKGLTRFGLPKGARAIYTADLYHTLLNMPRYRFLTSFFCVYLLLYLAFAFLYLWWITDECIYDDADETGRHMHFGHAFWFSVQTASTIGYSTFLVPNPDCPGINMLATFQLICAALIDTMLMSLVFARFAAPMPRASTIRFSTHVVLFRRDASAGTHPLLAAQAHARAAGGNASTSASTANLAGGGGNEGGEIAADGGAAAAGGLGGADGAAMGPWVLSFRLANIRKHSLLEPQITLLLVVPDRSAGSNAEYRFVPLAIEDELSQITALKLGLPATVTHVIGPNSPLWGLSLDAMEAAHMELLCFMNGVDPMTSNSLQARHAYLPSDVRMNERFVSISLQTNRQGKLGIDFSVFDDTSTAEIGMGSRGPSEAVLYPVFRPGQSSQEVVAHMQALRHRTISSLSNFTGGPGGAAGGGMGGAAAAAGPGGFGFSQGLANGLGLHHGGVGTASGAFGSASSLGSGWPGGDPLNAGAAYQPPLPPASPQPQQQQPQPPLHNAAAVAALCREVLALTAGTSGGASGSSGGGAGGIAGGAVLLPQGLRERAAEVLAGLGTSLLPSAAQPQQQQAGPSVPAPPQHHHHSPFGQQHKGAGGPSSSQQAGSSVTPSPTHAAQQAAQQQQQQPPLPVSTAPGGLGLRHQGSGGMAVTPGVGLQGLGMTLPVSVSASVGGMAGGPHAHHSASVAGSSSFGGAPALQPAGMAVPPASQPLQPQQHAGGAASSGGYSPTVDGEPLI